jgi:hypothetical protein
VRWPPPRRLSSISPLTRAYSAAVFPSNVLLGFRRVKKQAKRVGKCVGSQDRNLPKHFTAVTRGRANDSSLDLRLELLRTSDVSSMLRRGTSHETMLITVNTRTFLAEAATAASVLPRWHSFDEKRQPGYVLALAGRCAR